jgi:NTP pyrophosphatase (non-canonical NTP hydrolase)
MEFNEYQIKARKTAIYPVQYSVIYPTLGLAGESGEVAEKVKKFIRDKTTTEDLKSALVKELGDVLWYISNIASDLDISLEEIVEINLIKLADRKNRNVLQCSGDNR